MVHFDTGTAERMAPARDRFYSAVVTGTRTHDGDPRLARHVANAHALDTRFGRVITKRTRDSPYDIDLAVAGVTAHERATFRGANPVVELEPMVAFR